MKNNYPLYVKWLEVIVWLFGRTQRFPKNYRYSLSQKIDNLCLEILELIVETIYSSSKQESLKKINLKLEVLRTLIQLCHRLELLNDSQYAFISGLLLESGKMVGGWLKSAWKIWLSIWWVVELGKSAAGSEKIG